MPTARLMTIDELLNPHQAWPEYETANPGIKEMTGNEFKAWFSGFCAVLEGQPNEKQWKLICDQVRAIDNPKFTQSIATRELYEQQRQFGRT